MFSLKVTLGHNGTIEESMGEDNVNLKMSYHTLLHYHIWVAFIVKLGDIFSKLVIF